MPSGAIKRIGIIVGLVLLVLGAYLYGFLGEKTYPEVAELDTASKSFEEYSAYFRTLAEEKGADYAYDVLRRAALPRATDVHLLGHVIGDILYTQKGMEGIQICTNEFRNACAHSVVIGILLEHGPSALPDIANTCKEAPGGIGAYTMCFHGLGHGVLAYNDYDLSKAVLMCKMTGTPEYQNREYIECVGGALMEMNLPTHDTVARDREYAHYFNDTDPLSPCDMAFMPKEVQPMCYSYLTPHLLESAGVDLDDPDPALFPKAIALCDTVPLDEHENRFACYGGFGKEFIGFGVGRNVSDAGKANAETIENIRLWCSAAGNEEKAAACDSSVLGSFFWGGESTPDASFTYCGGAEEGKRGACYAQLADQIAHFLRGQPEGIRLCGRLPEPFRFACSARIR